MSRIGKKPITIPAGVDVTIDGSHVAVKGPRGSLERDLHPDMRVVLEDGEVRVERPSDERLHRSLHGLTRTLVANMVEGVTNGYEKRLEIVGVGYRAALKDADIELALGFSHPVDVAAPPGIEFEVPAPNRIVIRGHRQAAGRPSGGEHPQDPQARAVQGQGRALRGRVRAQEGRQGSEGSRVMQAAAKREGRVRRHARVRKKVSGTAERPRLAVYRSNRHIYAQLVDDAAARTLASASDAGHRATVTRAPGPSGWARPWPSGRRRPASNAWCSTAAAACTTAG